MSGETVQCRGGMRMRSGWSYTIPLVKLLGDADRVTLTPLLGRAVVIERAELRNVFAVRSGFGYAVHFDDGTLDSLGPAFLVSDADWLLSELARLGWPCEPAPRR